MIFNLPHESLCWSEYQINWKLMIWLLKYNNKRIELDIILLSSLIFIFMFYRKQNWTELNFFFLIFQRKKNSTWKVLGLKAMICSQFSCSLKLWCFTFHFQLFYHHYHHQHHHLHGDYFTIIMDNYSWRHHLAVRKRRNIYITWWI